MSRLDMDTYQKSIKTDILLQYFGVPQYGYQINYNRDYDMVPTELT